MNLKTTVKFEEAQSTVELTLKRLLSLVWCPKRNFIYVRFEVVTAVLSLFQVFQDVTACHQASDPRGLEES